MHRTVPESYTPTHPSLSGFPFSSAVERPADDYRTATDAPVELRELLEALIEIAQESRERSDSAHPMQRVGAAVFAESYVIYTGCSHSREGAQGLCAERTAMIKALQEGNREFRAMAIYGSDPGSYPYPCGACRQLLSEYGDFEVVLVRGDGRTRLYRVSDLLPNGPLAGARARASESGMRGTVDRLVTRLEREERAEHPRDAVIQWSVEDVVEWASSVGFGRYERELVDAKIRGDTLLLLKESDLERIGVRDEDVLPLYNSILSLRDCQLRSMGVEVERLHDYVALLDRERLVSVAHLKRVFDTHDGDRDGSVTRDELMSLLSELKLNGNDLVLDWLERLASLSGGDRVTFEDFVDAYNRFVHQKDASTPVRDLSQRSLRRRSRVEWASIKRRIGWRSSLQRISPQNFRRLHYWFDLMDSDHDGRITVAQALRLLTDQGYLISEDRFGVFMSGRGHVKETSNEVALGDVAEAAVVFCSRESRPPEFRMTVDPQFQCGATVLYKGDRCRILTMNREKAEVKLSSGKVKIVYLSKLSLPSASLSSSSPSVSAAPDGKRADPIESKTAPASVPSAPPSSLESKLAPVESKAAPPVSSEPKGK